MIISYKSGTFYSTLMLFTGLHRIDMVNNDTAVINPYVTGAVDIEFSYQLNTLFWANSTILYATNLNTSATTSKFDLLISFEFMRFFFMGISCRNSFGLFDDKPPPPNLVFVGIFLVLLIFDTQMNNVFIYLLIIINKNLEIRYQV